MSNLHQHSFEKYRWYNNTLYAIATHCILSWKTKTVYEEPTILNEYLLNIVGQSTVANCLKYQLNHLLLPQGMERFPHQRNEPHLTVNVNLSLKIS